MFNFLLQNDALSAIVAFILVLIPAVLIHELGHFIAAKSVGITILEFGIGMPPRLVKLFTLGGTDYTLNWLPLGGFVRPLGEDMVRQLGNDAVEVDREEAENRGIKKTLAVNEAPPLARILFLAGGALANFLLAFVLFTLIATMGIPQVAGGIVSVDYIAPDSALAQAGVQSQDVISTINSANFSSASGLLDQLAAADGEPVTLGIVRGDQGLEVTLTPTLTAEQTVSGTHPVVLDVSAGSPAATAGLQVGDLITAFNGEPVADFEALRS
ncbi:MAG: site-2 protease family protein [Anaerolineae bacterium]